MSRFLSFQVDNILSRGLMVAALAALLITLAPMASAQGFTLTMGGFDPFAVDPGGNSSAPLTITPQGGFTGTVSLSCQATSNTSGATAPQCTMSPPTVQPPGSATTNIVTTFVLNGKTVTATPGAYTAVVTGTATGATTQQAGQTITVLAVNPEFTITIQSTVLPSSVHAGSGGIGTVNINPVFGYGGNGTAVTMSCASITPLVTVPPVCQFSPNPVPVTAGVVAQTDISVNTFGPIPAEVVTHRRFYYALWLPVPLMLLAGFGAATGGRRTRKAWGVLALFILGGSLLLVPGCSNATVNKSTPNGVTPNDTYTFTLQGVDNHGNISTNTGTNNVAPTVTLTVD